MLSPYSGIISSGTLCMAGAIFLLHHLDDHFFLEFSLPKEFLTRCEILGFSGYCWFVQREKVRNDVYRSSSRDLI